MMHNEIREIYEALSAEYNTALTETEEFTAVSLEIPAKHFGVLNAVITFRNNDGSLHMRIHSLMCVDPSERQRLLADLNQLNGRYRFLRFSCDPDGHINVDQVFPRNAVGLTECVMEMVRDIFVNILALAFRRLKDAVVKSAAKTVWMTPALSHVRDVLEDGGYSCNVAVYGKDSQKCGCVVLQCMVHGRSYDIRFSHQPDEAMIACLPQLMHTGRGNHVHAQMLVRLLNRRLEDVRFEMDEQNNINICYDFPEEDDDPSDDACYAVRLLTDAACIALPLLEKELGMEAPVESNRKGNGLDAIERELVKKGYLCKMNGEKSDDERVLMVMIQVQESAKAVHFVERDGRLKKVCLFRLVRMEKREDQICAEPLLAYLDTQSEGLAFTCDSDGDVNIGYDFLEDDDDIASFACDLVDRFSRAASMAYPLLQTYLGDD